MRAYKFDFSGIEVTVEQPIDPELLFDELLKKESNDPAVADERIPYWAEIWPSAIGLSKFIADNRELVNGKTVLEIGCGAGLAGITAAMAGGKVELTDYLQEAIELAEHNWKLNFSTKAITSLLDWRSPLGKSAEVVLASDVAYESRSFQPLVNALQSLVVPGGIILLSEPNRKFSSAFFKALSENGFEIFESKQVVVKDNLRYVISIYTMKRSH